MDEVIASKLYQAQIEQAAALDTDWTGLEQKTFVISGASGMIGSCLIDTLMMRNRLYGSGIRIVGMGRDWDSAKERFSCYEDDGCFQYLIHNVNDPLPPIPCDAVIHAASHTHPVQYAADPIGTIQANVIGTGNMLELAASAGPCRMLFLSSVEIYGQGREAQRFCETDCGYIDCNTLRAGYPESKRVGETLCQAYRASKGLDVVIARLARTYGPTMRGGDSKAVAQFIKKAAADEDIVLKSGGGQLYSYAYVVDAATALITLLARGESGQAYNVAGDGSDLTLKELAQRAAALSGRRVVFERPDETEARGYSKAASALLDCGKLKSLGWRSRYDIHQGLADTLCALKEAEILCGSGVR